MTTHSLEDIARATGLALWGDGAVRVRFPAPPDLAGPGDLAVATAATYGPALAASGARAAILWAGADPAAYDLDAALFAPRPRVALAHLTQFFDAGPRLSPGVHPTALIDPGAELGAGVSIGPYVTIGPDCVIGPGTRIASHVSIAEDVRIGAEALIYEGTRIGARTRIGDRFVAQPNAVIGADGFSFEPPTRGAVEAARETGEIGAAGASHFLRIHSLAGVLIGDDVEVGAATTIDRGTLVATRIGSGTKIDNQVQIAHNVVIGETCLICAQVGIAGSAQIGDRVVLAGKVGVGDHRRIGSDVVCAAGTLIAGNVPDRSVMMGIPGVKRDDAMKQVMALRRLPALLEQVAQIRSKLGL